MKKAVFSLFIIAALLLQGAFVEARTAADLLGYKPANPDEAAIATLLLKQEQAIANKDAEGSTALYDDDADVDTMGWGAITKTQLTGKMMEYISDIYDFKVSNLKIYFRNSKEALALYNKSFSSGRGYSEGLYLASLIKKPDGTWTITRERIIG